MRKTSACSGAACAVTLLLASLGAPAGAAVPPGPYLGVGAGVYTLDIKDLSVEDFNFDDQEFDDTAAMVRAFGGIRLGPYLAVEADYQRLAESKDALEDINVDLDVHAWTVSARPIIPIGEVVDLYGRAGWTWYDAEAHASAGPFEVSFDGNGDDFTWGGGVDVHLGSFLTLRGDYSRIEIEDTDLDIVSAGVLFRF